MTFNDFHRERHKQGKKKTTIQNLENIIKGEYLVNCTHNKKTNAKYSISFIENPTKRSLGLEKEFDNTINSKTKQTKSIHEGEDITICWIETMTIKEDKTVQPPRRLVIREYTISFENSATIPERYIECKRLEGELIANDPEIGKTALFEVIDEDSKVSRNVNFTSIAHMGDVMIWQYKTVKCGVGPVVSKNVMEWKDDADNTRKRIEIKVSPKLRRLTAKNKEEFYMESSEEKETTTDIDDMNTTEACKVTESDIYETTTYKSEVSTEYLEISTTDKVVTELSKSTNESKEDVSNVSSPEEGMVSELSITTERSKSSIEEEILTTKEPELSSGENMSTTSSIVIETPKISSEEEVSTEPSSVMESSEVSSEVSTESSIVTEESLSEEISTEPSITESPELSSEEEVSTESSITEKPESLSEEEISTESSIVSEKPSSEEEALTESSITEEPELSSEEEVLTESSITEKPESSSEEEALTESIFTEKPFEEVSTEPSIVTEKPSSEEVPTETSIMEKSESSVTTEEGHLDCENSSACAVQHVTSLSTEVPITLTDTSLVDIITSTATNQMKVAELSTQEIPSFSTEASIDSLKSVEENTSEVIPNLVTKATDLPTSTISEYSSISMKSLESTSLQPMIETTTIIEDLSHERNITTTVLDITTPSVMKSTEKEIDSTSKVVTPIWKKSMEDTTTIVSTSKQPEDKTYLPLDRFTTVPSKISKQDVTTEKSPFVESVEEPGETDKILDKLSKPFSIENITEIASIRSTTIESFESIEHTPSESLSIDTSTTEFLQTSEEVPSVESEESSTEEIRKTTTPQISMEEFVPIISTSAISNIITTTLPTTENEFDYMCSNSDDCASASTSELCDDSEDCSSSKESCESGTCEEQSIEDKSDMTSTIKVQTPIDLQSSEIELSSTTVATLISEEVSDNNSMAINNVPTTVETRRSTPLSTTSIPKHKLILKIKVLLEHVNEKEEKEKLVEVEKQLSLDENPEHHRDPNFLKQLKSSNESISMEAVNALLNCTSLGNLTNVGLFKERPRHDMNSDIDISSRSEESQYAYSADPISEQSSTSSEQVTYEDQYPDFDEEYETRKRKRRGFAGNREDIFLNAFKKNSFASLSSDFINLLGTLNANSMRENTGRTNIFKKRISNNPHSNERNEIKSIKKANNERRKMEIVRRALPEVAKDLSVGLRDVMSQLTRHDSISANNPKKKVDKMNLLDIIADPKDNRFHSRRKRAATEEIGRWSNERIRKMPTGGNLRSFTEFVLYDILS